MARSVSGDAQTVGMTTRYIGSGPYCYANCMAMALADGIEPGLLEVLTGSPFGLQLLDGRGPLFDPLGWNPEIGIDAAPEPRSALTTTYWWSRSTGT